MDDKIMTHLPPATAIASPPASRLAPPLTAALGLLLQADDYARELNCSKWDFAVEIAALRSTGITLNDLRWLVCKRYVEHAQEITRLAEDTRQFRPSGKLNFANRSSFILTEAGAAFARRQREQTASRPGAPLPAAPRLAAETLSDPPASNGASPHNRLVPQWDCHRREVRVDGQLVKQFKLPSPNQETILVAFQEEGWPPRIDDPLPPQADQDPKQRLHDTIRSLNRNQKARLIRFKGDGTGTGILWEAILSPAD